MKKYRLLLSASLLVLCIMATALLEASRYSQTLYVRLKLLSHGYLSYELGESPVFVGTRAEDCPERIFKHLNYGRPVYVKGDMVGCITKTGWFTPVGVNDGRHMLQWERRFIVTLTWSETLVIAIALVSLSILICTVATIEIRRVPRLLFVSLVPLFLLCTFGIASGGYGIAVFKQTEWGPFHPDYGISLRHIMPGFRVPPSELLIFWSKWSIAAWCAVATILTGTLLLSLRRKNWLPAFAATYVAAVLFAGCGIWIWQSAMMNWYEMWLM